MSVSGLEHFGSIETKGWDLYQHNIGLRPTARYKGNFVLRSSRNTFQIYDKKGNLLNTLTTRDKNIYKVVFVPSRGKVVVLLYDGSYLLDVIDVRTGIRDVTINIENATTRPEFDVFENGDIYTLNRQTGTLYIHNIKGELLEAVNNFGINHNEQLVFANSKLGLFGRYNGASTFDIYGKNEVSTLTPRFDDIPSSTNGISYNLTSKGYYIHAPQTVSDDLVIIVQINHLTKEITNTLSVRLVMTKRRGTHHPVYKYLTSFDGKLYFQGVSDDLKELIVVDEETGLYENYEIHNIPSILDLDDEFIIAFNATGVDSYRIHSMKDFSLLYTIPSLSESYVDGYSMKGRYENFYKYW